MPLGAGSRVAAHPRAPRGAGGSTQVPEQPPRLCLRGGAGRGRRGPAELPGSVPAAPAYKERLAVPERRVPRSAPVAPGAAVGEVLGGERVPRDASPRGSPLSALVRLCTSPRVPGPAWAAAGPVRSRCLPVRSEPGRCRGREPLGPLCAPRCPVLRTAAALHCTDFQAEPPFAWAGADAALGVRQKVSDTSLGASRALGPPPAPARRGAAGTLLHVGEGQPGRCPPSPHRKVPALLPGVAKPPPDDPPPPPDDRELSSSPWGRRWGLASFPDCIGSPYTQALTPATC